MLTRAKSLCLCAFFLPETCSATHWRATQSACNERTPCPISARAKTKRGRQLYRAHTHTHTHPPPHPPSTLSATIGPRHAASVRRDRKMSMKFKEAPKTHPNPEIPRNCAFTRAIFQKQVRANFCILPCDTSQERNGHCSEKLVQMNLFILGGFFCVDFPPVKQ